MSDLREQIAETFDRQRTRLCVSNDEFADEVCRLLRDSGWIPPDEIADPCDTCGGRRLVYDGSDSGEQDECPDCTIEGLRRSRDQADAWARQLEQESTTKAELIEQACAGAVVKQLHACPDQSGQRCHDLLTQDGCDGCDVRNGDYMVPTASVGPFGWLVEAVGERLSRRCMYRRDNGYGWCDTPPSEGCGDCPGRAVPFVAVRSELLVGGKPWVEWTLVSAACADCGGTGRYRAEGEFGDVYEACLGCQRTGARTDVKDIADRYQPDRPWRYEGTARVARFRVRAS